MVLRAVSHNYAKIKVDLYDSLTLEPTKTFHNVIILIKSVFNIFLYVNIFFEKASYELPKKQVLPKI